MTALLGAPPGGIPLAMPISPVCRAALPTSPQNYQLHRGGKTFVSNQLSAERKPSVSVFQQILDYVEMCIDIRAGRKEGSTGTAQVQPHWVDSWVGLPLLM